jgi:NAD(P)-dependent dehydrogenase (short-subunit alcohol dehydrogenase family)
MEQRVTLVTGASSGIGRATAISLAERGAALHLLARRRDELERTAEQCRARGASAAHVVVADVTDREEVEEAVRKIVADHGRLDAVLHAAAVVAYGDFVDIPPEVFDRVQATNIVGSANVARAAMRQFHAQGRGDLVSVGSVLGKVTAPFMTPYVTSKWAMHGLARTLQLEPSSPDIHVGLVEPGGVDTTIYRKAANFFGIGVKAPSPVSTPEDVARAVVRMLDRPRRVRNVGPLNLPAVLTFRITPAVFDRVMLPLFRRIGLTSEPADPHEGNVFAPLPEPGTPTPSPTRVRQRR